MPTSTLGGEAYRHQIYKGKTYHFHSYNNTETAFNKVMLCIRKKSETPTEYVPYAPSNVELAEEKADKSETTVNLFKPTLETTTKNGVTCTNNGDGTYTLNGTNNSGDAVVFWCGNTQKFKAGTYKLLGTPNNTTASIGGSIYGHVEYEGVTVSSDSEISGDVEIVIPNGISCDNLTFKPMLTTNLNATYDDFVQYTGDTGRLNGDVASLLKRIEILESLVNKADTTVTE